MELYQKIYVDPKFLETEHGEIPCRDCHGGNPNDGNWQTAHTALVKDPSFLSPGRVCGECHPDIAASAVNSLHYTLDPMYEAVFIRSADGPTRDKLKPAMDRHCGSCHASCGQCHVSRPDYAKGGFLLKHNFVKSPSMDTTCASCHGGRVYAEFTGDDDEEELSPDLHFEDEEMDCMDCHTGNEMHADVTGVANRYELPQKPTCRQCHEEVFSKDGKNKAHTSHKGKLDCRVCHSQAYKNCSSCHVGTDKKGLPYFKCKKTGYDFKIGLNPEKIPSRPYEFVLVRHVPVDPDTFKFYGAPLDRFEAQPTWKPASPHNLLRKTSQNQTCNNCHGNASLFLRGEDLAGRELSANQKIIVPLEKIPKKISEE